MCIMIKIRLKLNKWLKVTIQKIDSPTDLEKGVNVERLGKSPV